MRTPGRGMGQGALPASVARRRFILCGPLLALVWATAVPAQAAPLSIKSEAGKFIVRVNGIARPERLNHLHGFDLALATAGGKPVSGASIGLTGRRRETNSPLPTLPQVSVMPGAGHYRVEGLRFHMPGEWQLIFAIGDGAIRDRAVLDIVVK